MSFFFKQKDFQTGIRIWIYEFTFNNTLNSIFVRTSFFLFFFFFCSQWGVRPWASTKFELTCPDVMPRCPTVLCICCKPSFQSVSFSGVVRIYLPVRSHAFSIFGRESSLDIFLGDLNECEVCEICGRRETSGKWYRNRQIQIEFEQREEERWSKKSVSGIF